MQYPEPVRFFLYCCLAASAAAQTLPNGPGKAVVERMCTPCHGLENVVRARMTKDRWGSVVDDMVSRGATGSDDEIDQVIAYLGTNFGLKRINVNKASPEDLASVLGIPPADAAAIVAYRNEKGSFKELRDLAKVPGIDAKKVEAAKDRLEF